MWVAPHDSSILTVRAFELYRGLCALRFPRVQRVRWDEDWLDAATFGNVLDADDVNSPPVVRADQSDFYDVVTTTASSSTSHPYGDAKRRCLHGGADAQTDDAATLEKATVAAGLANGQVVSGGRAACAVVATGRGADVSGVEPVCDTLHGTVVCEVCSDATRKHAKERRIHERRRCFVHTLGDDVDTV